MVVALGRCALLTSSYLTVSISVERFCGICYPLKSRLRGDRRVVLYILPVLIFCFLYNIPCFLEISEHIYFNWGLTNNLLYKIIYK